MSALVQRRRQPPTPVRRWEPFRELEELQERTAELMESMMPGGETGPWVPAVDIEETDDAWIVEAEVPGVRREDVEVELREAELVISGEIRERERTGILRRRTRRTGEFELRVTLPGPANAEKIDATLKDGVLTVTVLKAEQARPRRIAVHDAEGA